MLFASPSSPSSLHTLIVKRAPRDGGGVWGGVCLNMPLKYVNSVTLQASIGLEFYWPALGPEAEVRGASLALAPQLTHPNLAHHIIYP